jgi:Holliday junction resolvase RusA-like endonuclease
VTARRVPARPALAGALRQRALAASAPTSPALGARPPAPVDVPILLTLPPPVAASHVRLQVTGNGKPARAFHEKKYADWRNEAAVAVLRGWPYAPIPAHTPVALSVTFVSERQKSRPAWCPPSVWASGEAFLRPVRPDLENMLEAVQDAMMPQEIRTRSGRLACPGVMEDDASVVLLENLLDVVAGVSQSPGVLVRLRLLPSLAVPLRAQGATPAPRSETV